MVKRKVKSGRRKQRVVIDGEELNLSLEETHEELKRRGLYGTKFTSGTLEGGGLWYKSEEVTDDGGEEAD